MNHALITELFEIIADGGLEENDIAAMSAEVIKAHADAQTYLANDPASSYKEEFAIPLWEWVLLEQLEDGLIFKSSQAEELYKQIEDAFGEGELELSADALTALTTAGALSRIQNELAPAFTLINFSKNVANEMQILLVRSNKLERFMALCQALGLAATASCANH
ncbi:hypothetical protein [Iodobacter sp.]|uniref:hypothetical protein n=1 Tax=Iodobacter sp. TaxID=1915058 RepID=UPI0025F76EC6|nr:hypothetical protein [Iodobacter sp.]